MKRKGYLAGIVLGVCLLLSGCGEGLEQEKTPTGAAVPTGQKAEGGQENPGGSTNGGKKPTPTESPELTQLRAQYPKYEPGSYVLADDPKGARRNQNLVNNGYLCEAEGGSVYYVDRADGMLYQSLADGSGRTLISEMNMRGLQEVNGVLYGADTSNTLYRYVPESGMEPVMEQKAGDFIVSEESIFYSGAGGIYRYDFAAQTTERLVDTGEYAPVWMTMGQEILVYTLISEKNPAFLQNGLVYCYSLEDGAVSLVAEKCYRAVLLGKRLIYQSYETNGLAWMDMETGAVTDLAWHSELDGEEFEIPVSTEKGFFIGDDLYFVMENYLDLWDPLNRELIRDLKEEGAESGTGEETGEDTEEKTGLAQAPWNADYIFRTEERIFLCSHKKGYYSYELSSGSGGVWGN